MSFGKFNQIFANDAIAHAIVDRLVNDAEVFYMEGVDSYRPHQRTEKMKTLKPRAWKTRETPLLQKKSDRQGVLTPSCPTGHVETVENGSPVGANPLKVVLFQTAASIDGRDQFRVVITDESNAAIEEIARKVNEGFGAGAVSKSDIANYVFLNLSKSILDSDIKALRALHFDDKKVLGTLLRGESELPDDLKKAIRMHYGISEKEKKRPSKTMAEGNVGSQPFGLDEISDAPRTKVQVR